MKHLFAFIIIVFGTTIICAQTVTTTVQTPVATTTIQMPLPVVAPKATTEIFAASSTAVVKGAPFSAEAVSESVQTLSDGNKITRSYTTKMYRDGEGRFRREGGGGAGGGVYTYGNAISVAGYNDVISIFDPVANQRFIINPKDKTARRFAVVTGMGEGAVIVSGQGLSHTYKAQIEANAAQKTNIVVLPNAATGVGVAHTTDSANSKTESLGTREFDGVQAEGTRTVTTIPAGTIGNERPIEIVYERWYSKELQLIVYSKHSDPRFGDQTYRLENISRSEPDRSLFTVPSDYKIIAESTYRVVAPTTTKQQ